MARARQVRHVATAAAGETETNLLSTYNATEFGVPVNGTPPTRFSWLGGSGYTAEQSSRAANPGGGTSALSSTSSARTWPKARSHDAPVTPAPEPRRSEWEITQWTIRHSTRALRQQTDLT
jgi:hypothetical protein